MLIPAPILSFEGGNGDKRNKKGKITHPDHKTILLYDWHRVVPNTENRAASMKHLAFID